MTALEVPVDTLEGVLAAKAGGAARVELCAALSEGGLTPSVGLMRAAACVGIPCFAMIRPRAGLFRFSEGEVGVMLEDIRAAKAAGLAGVVLGAQGADGRLDLDVLARLKAEAAWMGTTLHRVIDVVPDPFEALEQAVALGFDRVLTSGGAASAVEGAEVIAEMVRRAAGRISVMPGAGLSAENVGALVARTGVAEVHASCSLAVAGGRSEFDPAPGRRRTDEDSVRSLVVALSSVSDTEWVKIETPAVDLRGVAGQPPAFEVLEALDHIRKRPGMYVGDTGRGGAAALVRCAVEVLAALTIRSDPFPYFSHHAFLDVVLLGREVRVVIDYHPDETPDIDARCRSLVKNADNLVPDEFALDRSANGASAIAVLSALSTGLHIACGTETVFAHRDPLEPVAHQPEKGAFVAAAFAFGERIDARRLTADFLEGFLHGNRIPGLVLRSVTVS